MMKIANHAEWDDFYAQFPQAHFLQSGAWGELKSRFGWRVKRVIHKNSGAQLLFRPLPFGYSVAYLAKGPLGDELAFYSEIDTYCRDERAVFLKIEPDHLEEDQQANTPNLDPLVTSKPVQPRRTVTVNLDGSEEEILGRMKQKTRYNIRLAEKKDVVVSPSSDIDAFHKMALVTAKRDAFGVHSLAYYRAFYELFYQDGRCELLTAYYNQQPLASLFVLAKGDRAYYLYGASSDLERNRMPAYLIQWEAMKWAKARGCRSYDLWGIPDLEEEELEASFLDKESHNGLWGVYRFKRGFGGEVQRSVGAWDRVYRPGLYKLYSLYVNRRGGEVT